MSSNNGKDVLDFEEVVTQLGFGKYQLLMYLLACIPPIFTGMQVVAPTFKAIVPEHRCSIEGCDSTGDKTYITNASWLQETTPIEDGKLSQCYTFSYNVSVEASEAKQNSSCNAAQLSREKAMCSSWQFDSTLFKSSLVSEFQLVCRNSWMKPLLSSLYMAGLLFGAPFWGFISDRFGRKVALISCTSAAGLVGISLGLMPNYSAYAFLNFINGICNIGIFQTSFVIGLEYVGVDYRMVCGIAIEFFFAAGEASVALFAYFVRDWRTLQIALSAPMCLAVLYYWLIPESPRWLLAKGKWEEARKVILTAAKTNEKVLPENLLPSKDTVLKGSTSSGHIRLVTALRNVGILRMTVIMSYAWLTSATTYYALSMNSSNLSGDVFVNFMLIMLAEIPGYIVLLFLMDRVGRRACTVAFFLVAGSCCMAAAFIPKDLGWLTVTLSLIGKMSISGSFAIVFVYTAELFPTVIRTSAIGACSTISRAGSILSPYIASLGTYNKFIPFVVCGALALVAAMLSLDLPETNGAKLPETIQDVETLRRKSKGNFLKCLTRVE